ncbi:uncharacterized protein B0T15DRAFT_496103 [Chaetomium strumarium]|uniref:Uncharacterized protein n=1 Tax=Chaetomium strumarium TaxID=1170767 RepID=A0AAJ0GP54_9PEZI|nr:hypothetical protein B0T15DRAFT_496103 [Chaetomium strumarium]
MGLFWWIFQGSQTWELSVTAIVTPAIRAVDEKTGAKLMSNQQELRCKDAREDAGFQEDAEEIKSVSTKCNEAHKLLKKAERKLESMTKNAQI